jgi:UPF0271 protein
LAPQPENTIDLNADLGEHDGTGYAADDALLGVVSSANIACGAHAGSRDVMLRTVQSAHDRGVAIGAHPSYPDRDGFGRRAMDIPMDELEGSVRDQIRALASCCADAGASLRYVKPHGALYNRAARDPALAAMLAGCIRDVGLHLCVLSPPQGELESAARAAGLRVAREAFIDRAYDSDGSLVARSEFGAVLTGAEELAARAVRIARDGLVEAIDGHDIDIAADSLCVHSDSPDALAVVMCARAALVTHGFSIRGFCT